MAWYYMVGRKRQGPVGLDELKSLMASGALSGDDLVWTKSMGKAWAKIADTPQLANMVQQAADLPKSSVRLKQTTSPASHTHIFPPPPEAEERAAGKKSGCRKAVGIGCLTTILLLALGGVIIYKNRLEIEVTLIRRTQIAALEATCLPAGQQAEIMAGFNMVTEDFENGEISRDQMIKIFDDIANGPFSSIVNIECFKIGYVERSNLSPEDKEKALLITSRYAEAYSRGGITDFDSTSVDQITTIFCLPSSTRADSYAPAMRASITPAERDYCLDVMKKEADRARIPQRLYTIDLKKVITEAIERSKAKQGL